MKLMSIHRIVVLFRDLAVTMAAVVLSLWLLSVV